MEPTSPLAPPSPPRPLLARLLAPPGPPGVVRLEHGDDVVLALPGRYSVSYLLVRDGWAAVVECGSHADVPGIARALEWLGIPPERVRYVLPTHLHFDHVMGLDALARHLGVPVALGPVAWEHVEGGRPLHWPPRLLGLRAIPTWPMQGMPVFTREDWRAGMGFGFPWSKNRFRAVRFPLAPPELPGFPGWTVLETPGHADDAVCLHHAAAGWLIAGDTLRNFLGGEWNPLTCDREAYEVTRARLSALPVTRVLPGHGPVFPVGGSLAELRRRPWFMP